MLSSKKLSGIKKKIDDGERLPVVFGALSDARRYKMFKILHEHKGLCVTEMARLFNISVPAASQQLKILERTGLISRAKSGQMICYAITESDPLVRSILKTIK